MYTRARVRNVCVDLLVQRFIIAYLFNRRVIVAVFVIIRKTRRGFQL